MCNFEVRPIVWRTVEPDAAERLLAKIRHFVVEELDPEERAMFAALIAPAVAKVWVTDEVEGFGHRAADWSPAALPDALRDALQRGDVRVAGLGVDQDGAETLRP